MSRAWWILSKTSGHRHRRSPLAMSDDRLAERRHPWLRERGEVMI